MRESKINRFSYLYFPDDRNPRPDLDSYWNNLGLVASSPYQPQSPGAGAAHLTPGDYPYSRWYNPYSASPAMHFSSAMQQLAWHQLYVQYQAQYQNRMMELRKQQNSGTTEIVKERDSDH